MKTTGAGLGIVWVLSVALFLVLGFLGVQMEASEKEMLEVIRLLWVPWALTMVHLACLPGPSKREEGDEG